LFNVNQFAFYRVNYNVDNWRALAKALRENPRIFDVKTFAQLIDDSLNLAREGFLSYTIVFDMLMDLKLETQFLPWSAAMRNLLQLHNLLTSSDIHHDFQVSAFS
jgi:ERAP1-like C-terminal domain